MTPRDFTELTVLRILASERKTLTYPELLREMLKATERAEIPLYLGPNVTLRDFLEQLANKNLIAFATIGKDEHFPNPAESIQPI